MSYRRVIQLWENDNEETHGGENNGGARRVFAPANHKYGNLKGLGSWTTDRRAFGTFWSGHGSDPVRGGGLSGQQNTVDYCTGMPDLRTEHLHAIDCGGFDRLRIVWKAECLAYEGLAIDWANVPLDTNSVYADGVYAIAFGEEVIESGLDYLNFPPALWANANDTLAGEGQGSTASLQCLANNALTGGTSWSKTGDFAGTDSAVYTHSSGTGTLTQTSGNFSGGVVASHRYLLKYTVSGSSVAGGSLALSGVGTAAGLPRTNGQHVIEFTSAASPGNFVLTNTSTSGAITIDDIFLVIDMRAGSDKRPRPMFAAPNNGVFAESELFRAPGALAIRGQGTVPAALSDISRYANAKIPNGLPVASAPSQQVAWGATQWGITYKGPTGIPYGRIPRAGDRYKVVMDIGLPTMSTPGTGAPATTQDASSQDLWITGLSRVYFAMCSVGVHFVNSPSAGESPTWLQSSPIGPATAPRQHIKGRLYAILSSLTPHPKGSPE